MIPEGVDLEKLRRALSRHFGDVPPAGYVHGKGQLRAAVVLIRKCSELEAEELVDTLEGRGLVRYGGDRAEELDDLEHYWFLGEP